MVHMVLYDSDSREACIIEKNVRELAAYNTGDCWNIEHIKDIGDLLSYPAGTRIEISCVDICSSEAIETVEMFRNKHKDTHIVLIADNNISPVKYMKPTILAAGLLLRPIEKTFLDACFNYIVEYMEKTELDETKMIVLSDENGKNRIPYSDILFLEAREKKIFINTEKEEYGFYSTLDNLIEKLPENFRRCHRGFIVNTKYIKKVVLSENTIFLSTGHIVPLSRSYKADLKEFK